jgi:hypothetical protein
MRIHMILAAAVMLGGLGLSGCERDEPNGVRVEVEGSRDRDSTLENMGESVERGADRTGDAIRDAGDDVRDAVRD